MEGENKINKVLKVFLENGSINFDEKNICWTSMRLFQENYFKKKI